LPLSQIKNSRSACRSRGAAPQRDQPEPRSGAPTWPYNVSVPQMLLQMMGRDPDDFNHVIDRAGHDLTYAIDPCQLRDELCWAPKHTDFCRRLICHHSTGTMITNTERPLRDAVET
jgi:hypothetical protein